jgi:hypothetical protein
MNSTISRSIATAVVAGALTVPLLFAESASAQGGGGGVRTSGHCVGGGVYELKAKHDDGRIEVEYEVDTNQAGQVWNTRITDNGTLVFSAKTTTAPPSGSFTVRRLIANRPGTDTIRASATLGGRSCGGTLAL